MNEDLCGIVISGAILLLLIGLGVVLRSGRGVFLTPANVVYFLT
jgi:hypothetical protein